MIADRTDTSNPPTEHLLRNSLPISEFPINVRPERLVQELTALFGERTQTVRDAIAYCGYGEVPDAPSPAVFYESFVKTFVGKRKDLVQCVLGRLSDLRSESLVLTYAVTALNESGDSDPTPH